MGGASSRQGARPPPLSQEKRGYAAPAPRTLWVPQSLLPLLGPAPGERGGASFRLREPPGHRAEARAGMWARGPGSDGSPHPGPFLATPSARPSASPPPGGLGNGRSQRGAGHPRRRAETPVLSFGGAMRVCAVNGSSPCTHPNLQARGARAEPRSSSPQQPDAPSPPHSAPCGYRKEPSGKERAGGAERLRRPGAPCGRDCRQERPGH